MQDRPPSDQKAPEERQVQAQVKALGQVEAPQVLLAVALLLGQVLRERVGAGAAAAAVAVVAVWCTG